ncbi:hypothetical protein [Burkholderia stagnalis]|nr:hypothetical protein [Burkholderia stagnalis]
MHRVNAILPPEFAWPTERDDAGASSDVLATTPECVSQPKQT